MNTSRLVHNLNVLALAVITAILAGAFAEQLMLGELPCPLCLLQRAGLIAAGLGFLLNLRFGLQPAHYGVALLGSLVGAAGSMRQILLHIAPGDPGYAGTAFGLHLYTWAFVAFVCLMIGTGVLLVLNPGASDSRLQHRGRITGLVMLSFVGIILANLVSTLLECGLTQCADNPVSYMLLDLLKSGR